MGYDRKIVIADFYLPKQPQRKLNGNTFAAGSGYGYVLLGILYGEGLVSHDSSVGE